LAFFVFLCCVLVCFSSRYSSPRQSRPPASRRSTRQSRWMGKRWRSRYAGVCIGGWAGLAPSDSTDSTRLTRLIAGYLLHSTPNTHLIRCNTRGWLSRREGTCGRCARWPRWSGRCSRTTSTRGCCRSSRRALCVRFCGDDGGGDGGGGGCESGGKRPCGDVGVGRRLRTHNQPTQIKPN
jgi:hypothetical protein